MKVHITNLYNFNPGDELVKKQHRIAEAGLSLGFREMGIFSFPVESDTPSELSKRLDGIIAALEAEDVVIFQLPTRNGPGYEKLLAQKIKAYKNTKLILLFHDIQLLDESNDRKAEYFSLCKLSDSVIVPSERDLPRAHALGIDRVLPMDDLNMGAVQSVSGDAGYNVLRQSDFYVKKILMDAVESVFESERKLERAAMCPPEDEIQIGFGLHDKTGNYSVWVGVTMQSVIEHTSAPICFHILHDDTLTAKNRERLIRVATQKGNRVEFHFLDKAMWDEYKEQTAGFTIGTLFRVMLPELLPNVEKIIYLDADLLVNRDIKELWDTNIEEYCLAAVPDYGVVHGYGYPLAVQKGEVEAEKYFNAGVLYLNLRRVRGKGNMCQMVLNYLKDHRGSKVPDQDALNSLYGTETILLDDSWNTFVMPLRDNINYKLVNRVYHFAGTRLTLYSLSELDGAYYETIMRTPWKDEEGGTQLSISLKRTKERLDLCEKTVAAVSQAKKKLIFYGEETHAMRSMYQLLPIREGDYRVMTESMEKQNAILPCRPLSDLREEKEEFVVFVLPEADNGMSIANLERMKLMRDKDYFVIPCLLSPERGGYM